MANKKIYACALMYDECFDPFEYRELYSSVRLEKMKGATNPEALRRGGAAEIALLFSIDMAGQGSAGLEIPFEYSIGENGKPVSRFGAVSMSHTHTLAAAAFSDCPVGIDIERVKKTSERLAKRILSGREYGEYAASSDPELHLIESWCAKESFLKLTGEGLGGSMQRAVFDREKGIITRGEECGFITQSILRIDEANRSVRAVMSICSSEECEIVFLPLLDAKRAAEELKMKYRCALDI